MKPKVKENQLNTQVVVITYNNLNEYQPLRLQLQT